MEISSLQYGMSLPYTDASRSAERTNTNERSPLSLYPDDADRSAWFFVVWFSRRRNNSEETPIRDSGRRLSDRYGLSIVDEADIDAFLAPAAGESPHAVLFFTATRPSARKRNRCPPSSCLKCCAPFMTSAPAVVARGRPRKVEGPLPCFRLPSTGGTPAANPLRFARNLRLVPIPGKIDALPGRRGPVLHQGRERASNRPVHRG